MSLRRAQAVAYRPRHEPPSSPATAYGAAATPEAAESRKRRPGNSPARPESRITHRLPAVSETGAAEQRTTPVELFWDLVFVFAVTQVSTLLYHTTSRGPGPARRCSSPRSCGACGRRSCGRSTPRRPTTRSCAGCCSRRSSSPSWSRSRCPRRGDGGHRLRPRLAKGTVAHATDPLDSGARLALCGGVALYLAGHTAFVGRLLGAFSVSKALGVGACAVVYLASGALAAWATAGLLAAVLALVVLAERSYAA